MHVWCIAWFTGGFALYGAADLQEWLIRLSALNRSRHSESWSSLCHSSTECRVRKKEDDCQKFWIDITTEKIQHSPQQKILVLKACQACGWISRSRRTQKSSEVAHFFYSMLMCRVRAVAWIGPTQACLPQVRVAAEEVAGEGVASRHH